MKMKFRFLILPFIGLSLLLLFLYCCKKDIVNPTNGKSTALFNPNVTYGSMTDQDGNTYKTVTIGSQTWMAENLRTTKYCNGDDIPEVTDNTAWINLSTGAYCNYQNTQNIDTIATYGRLYNWAAVNDNRKIIPNGWHVPTHDDWIILETYLVDSLAGIKLKESGNTHWNYFPLFQVTNETGFTALPGGYRVAINGDGFINMGIEGGWWTVSEEDLNNLDNVYHVTMGYNYSFLGGCNCPKNHGYSIRCVMD
ncbi:MAG: fibrobacter succinogenes major paralogous domain-containing protein [Bacteroidales bacterium]|nr:fibrobacter succinogenes major paralogous domain-containing protein [Bacteroidales bacterium]